MAYPFTQPLIADPGCAAPVVAPLISGALAGPDVCAPNLPGVHLPANDLGVTNASTNDALFTTPEIAATFSEFRGERYSRILPPGETQVTAMVTEHPRLVAVDLGGAEVLGPIFGNPADVIPYDDWQKDYDEVIARVKGTGARAVLVWFNSDVALLSGERRGWELWADRAEFAAQHFVVPPECNTTGRDNLVNIADFLFQIVDARLNQGDPPVLSCTDIPDAEEDVLTPDELRIVRADAVRREAHIKQLARRNGYAFVSIDDALHSRPGFKPPFSFTALLYSSHPYGPLMSLDELHPNALGHALIAKAAAAAISSQYDLDLGDGRSPQ